MTTMPTISSFSKNPKNKELQVLQRHRPVLFRLPSRPLALLLAVTAAQPAPSAMVAESLRQDLLAFLQSL